MAESKSTAIQPTAADNQSTVPAPERLDRAHTASAGPPHANFARSERSASKMPSKLQERMERLMADLADLDEPKLDPASLYTPAPGELTEIPSPTSNSTVTRRVICENKENSDLALSAEIGDAEANASHAQCSPLRIDSSQTEQFGAGDTIANGMAALAYDESTNIEVRREDDQSEPLATITPEELLAYIPAGESIEPPNPIDDPMFVKPTVGPTKELPLSQITSSFSQQAREILEILRRRQEQLSYQKNELELREASLEKQLRQERLALVEKHRQLLSDAVVGRTVETSDNSTSEVIESQPSIRRITPEWILQHERGIDPVENAHIVGLPPTSEPEESVADLQPNTASAPENLHSVEIADQATDPNPSLPYQVVIEEFVRRQVGSAGDSSAVDQRENPSLGSDAPILRQKADQLRQQHESAISAMRQTRRQLELLKNIVVQQQSQWAERTHNFDSEQANWDQIRRELYDAGQQRQAELEQLRVIEQNELAKQQVSVEQREAAVRRLEERLQQAQVEILRDRVIIKQLERTARQSLSNADWNQRWQVISEETHSYLKKVNEDAQAIQAETKRQVERLESRKSEMLLYREAVRSWIERQMKLISRRAALVNDREQQLHERWETLQEGRRSLQEQQSTLNEWLAAGLNEVDDRLDHIPHPSRHQDAA